MIRAEQWANLDSRARFLWSDRRLWLVATWLVLQLLDVSTTALGLRMGLREANGFAANAFAQFGEAAVYGSKVLLGASLVAVILLLQPRYPRLWLGLRIMNWYMLFAVSFNLLNIGLEA